jgi:hypothetical protein
MKTTDFTVISTGDPKLSLRAALLSDWFTRIANTPVSVPSSVTNSLFIFSFQRTLDSQELLKDMSMRRVSVLMKLMAAAINDGAKPEVIQDLAGQAGLNLEIKDGKSIADRVRAAIEQTFTQRSLSSFFIKSALDNPGAMADLSAITKINFPDIFGAVKDIQEWYATIATSSPVAEVTAKALSMMSNPAIGMTRQLDVIFHSSEGGSIPSTLSTVMNIIREGTVGEPIIEQDTEIRGVLYKVNSFNMFPEDAGYKDVALAYFMLIRAMMGLETAAETKTVEYHTMFDAMMTGVGMPLPFLPAELKPETMARAEHLIRDLFMTCLIERIIKREYGNVASNLRSIMDDRRYRRDDAYDQFLQQSIDIMSAVFSSFLDTAGQLRQLLDAPNIYYSDVHPIMRSKYTKIIHDYLGAYSSFSTSTDSRRRLHDLALIVNEKGKMTFSFPDTIIPDSALKVANQRFLSNSDGTEWTSFAKQDTTSSVWDAPIPIAPMLISYAADITVVHGVQLVVPPFLAQTEAFKAVYTLIPLDDVVEKFDISQRILERGTITYVSSLNEFAARMDLPLDIANRLFTAPGFYLHLTNASHYQLYWDRELAPVFEVKLVSPENFHVAPWIAPYPYLMKSMVTNQQITPTDTVVDPASGLTPGMTVTKKKGNPGTPDKGKGAPSGNNKGKGKPSSSPKGTVKKDIPTPSTTPAAPGDLTADGEDAGGEV